MSIIEQFLVSQIFTALIIFCRVGSGLMVLPGFGEGYVSMRVRLLLALSISVLLTPLLQSSMPPIPDSPLSLLVLLVGEIMIGIAIAMVCRFIISVMHIAGMVIAYNASLALAMQFDTTQASQGSLIGNLLSLSAVVLLFTMDMHFVMLRGLGDSYTLFQPGVFPPVDDLAMYYSRLLSDVFRVAIQIASPSIVIGLLIYLVAGILARLMPTMQVFFVIMPVQIFLALFILSAIYVSIMMEFTNFFTETYGNFLQGEI